MQEIVVRKTFYELFREAVKIQPRVFVNMAWLILFIVIVKDLYLYCGGMPKHYAWMVVISFVMAVLLIYLYAACQYTAFLTLEKKYTSLSDVLLTTSRRAVHLYGLMVFYVALVVGFYYLAYYIGLSWVGLSAATRMKFGIIMLVFAAVPIMYGLILTCLAIPLVVNNAYSVWAALRLCMRISWDHWLYILGLYICGGVVFILTSPNTLHEHFLIRYYLNAPFDYIVFAAFLPIIFTLSTLMLAELRRVEAV